MTQPIVDTFAQDLYDKMIPLNDEDESYGWATLHYLSGIGTMFQEVSTLAEDNNVGTVTQQKTIRPREGTTATVNAATIQIPVPTSTVDGDLLVAYIFEGSGSGTPVITPPAGWTAVGQIADIANSGFHVFYRVANSEPANYTWTFHVSARGCGAIIPFENVDTSSPVILQKTTTRSGTFDIPIPQFNIEKGQVLIAGGATKNGTTFTTPSRMTELLDIKTGTADLDRSMVVAYLWAKREEETPAWEFIDDGPHDSTDVLSKALVLNPATTEIAVGESPGWSVLLDLERIDPKGLGWLAQLVGVQLDPNLADAEQRDRIGSTDGFRRGTPGALDGAARQYLTGTKTVVIRERYGGAWKLNIVSFDSETPDPDRVLAAILSQKPAGITLDYNVLPGQDFQSLLDDHDDFQDVLDTYADLDDVRLNIPI